MRSGIFKEATVVGGSLFVVGAALMQFRRDGITDKQYWPYLGVFITGFSAHLIFEAFGLNKKYCDVAFNADPDDWDEDIDWDNEDEDDKERWEDIEWDAEAPVEYWSYVPPLGQKWGGWAKGEDYLDKAKQHEITEFEKEMDWAEKMFNNNRYFCKRYEDVPYSQRRTYSGNNLRRGNRCYNCRSKECPRCGVSRAITKSTILLSTEEKEGLFKTSPQLFSEIDLELRSAIESRVTATYVECKNCGNQLECSLKTDAHITDDYRE